MDSSNTSGSYPSFISNNTKVRSLESTLLKSLDYFKELISDIQELYIESENTKSKFMIQKELCERNNCSSAENFKNIIQSKNNILQSVASTLITFNETRNFNLIDEVFRIICGEPTLGQDVKNINTQKNVKKELNSIEMDLEIKEDSLNEIEGTPTGQKSPIIQMKKSRKITTNISSDYRDKMKCPDNWPTSENKSIKLLYTTPSHTKPGGKLRQTRLNLIKEEHSSVVHLTSPIELSGESSSSGTRGMQLLSKNKHSENDTILPSPTSVPVNFTFKGTIKRSPIKCSKSSLSLKTKKGNFSKLEVIRKNVEKKTEINKTAMDDSIKLLNQLPRCFNNDGEVPIKMEPIDDNETHYETNLSLSVLDGDELEQNKLQSSPKQRRPLTENMNVTNTPPKKNNALSDNNQSKYKINSIDNVKRCMPGLEPVYKETISRKKNEKRALPGWLCEECEHFFGELYKDNPTMLAKKIEECSKHRGRKNPIRPKTPPNFWNPRWSVPKDTQELNRMNNAI